MMDFAERTGLTGSRHPRRYLWTDAFAVCNFLGFGSRESTALAVRLVDQVHHTLGKHRLDDTRRGWLSGLSDADGEVHPTRGGLRIGKPLAERGEAEPLDAQLEWERDGQYFHYLTRWMHALDQLSRATDEPRYNRWARELAAAAYRGFATRSGGGPPRLAWKMSIDLSRPAVPSMGQHDALDGLITCLQLKVTAAGFPEDLGPTLDPELTGLAAMTAAAGDWVTTDALGIGGLLIDAFRVAQLIPQTPLAGRELLPAMLAAARSGLERCGRSTEFSQLASRRLGFRELGLSIGLHALESPRFDLEGLARLLEPLRAWVPFGLRLESFWLDPAHRQTATWEDHRDINEVMLATSLAPDGFLLLSSGRGRPGSEHLLERAPSVPSTSRTI